MWTYDLLYLILIKVIVDTNTVRLVSILVWDNMDNSKKVLTNNSSVELNNIDSVKNTLFSNESFYITFDFHSIIFNVKG